MTNFTNTKMHALTAHAEAGKANADLAQISKGAGETANRPTTATVGCMFYDTTLGKPIWLNSTGPNVWKDAAGSTV